MINITREMATVFTPLSYPLYQELLRRAQERKEKCIDIKRVCNTITNIATTHTLEEMMDHYEEIEALAIHHELSTNNGILFSSIPYDGKLMIGGKGILHYIMNFPPVLQQIIAQYIEDPNVSSQ